MGPWLGPPGTKLNPRAACRHYPAERGPSALISRRRPRGLYGNTVRGLAAPDPGLSLQL